MEALFGQLYSELHRLARREFGRQGVPVSLSATTLLHEACLIDPSLPDAGLYSIIVSFGADNSPPGGAVPEPASAGLVVVGVGLFVATAPSRSRLGWFSFGA